MPAIVALFGPKRGLRVDLEGDVVIGRASSAELQLIDGKVSREHCRLCRAEGPGGGIVLHDLGSQNGTFVNGERVNGNRALARGDEIAIGDSLFLVDPDLAVMASRFGDATLVVAGEARAAVVVAGEAPQAGSEAATAAEVVAETMRSLAARLAAASGTEEAARAVLAAIDERVRPARAFILLGDGGAGGVRLLLGHDEAAARSTNGPAAKLAAGASPPTPVLDRALLSAAASRRRALLVSRSVEERTFAGGKSVALGVARATLVAPIAAGDGVAGFFYLDRAARAGFAAGEVALVEAIAALTGVHGLGGALASSRAQADAAALTDGAAPVGASRAFARVLKLADAAARAPSTVLVTGESGTGKEEIARYIHRKSGRGPFVALNCGAIAESLAESELFGHDKGAFTGAVAAREGCIGAADGGTLFLDEVGELSPATQVKLLRVLQERVFHRVGSTVPRSVDLRVIAATNRRLEDEIVAGRFREDLFYRLNVLRLDVPPLRERSDDVAPLAAVLLARIARGAGRPNPGLTDAALARLAASPWPGNARELGNVLERALVLRDAAARGPLGADEIDEATAVSGRRAPVAGGGHAAVDAPSAGAARDAAALPDKVAALERDEIRAALKAARGVKARAAKALGISRPTLDKKIDDLDIDPWRDDAERAGPT